MTKQTYHVLPVQDGGWKVKKGGAARASKRFEEKDDAINFAKNLSSSYNTQLVIHRKDGSIQNANSYGNDSFPPKEKV